MTSTTPSFSQKIKLTTPRLLKTGLYATWVTSFLVAIATISGIQQQRQMIQTIGKDAAPSVLLAQRIQDSLLGMDANAVNELLVKPGANPRATEYYEERRKAFAERIIAAAENITYGKAEREPIKTMQLLLGDYIAKIQRARDFNERGDLNGVLTAYREAAEIMDNKLLPEAEKLKKVNAKKLDETYDLQQIASFYFLFLTIVPALLLVSVLIAIQLFLHWRMRRILNPWLIAATAIAIFFLVHTTQTFLAISHHLKIATKDSFESLRLLREARALVYSSNADESRYLLDKANAVKHEKAFLSKSTIIAQPLHGETLETVAVAGFLANNQKPRLAGLLGEAFNDITFAGEREAAVATLLTFDRYLKIDRQIRLLEQSGKHQEAIALCTGYEKGQSNWAFEEFKKAHNKMQDINQEAFNKAVEQGFKDIEGFEISAAVAAILISVLTLFGLLLRIQEYR
ncbi:MULTISPECIES: hypothetical protein [Nostocales]|uniref:Uncharacterized protein n=3 Tax=Nostocales TaxID=1161 RepID=A0A0C1R6N2_9CYAN|nr:hypothetical protein [Tolypothrix bouteillei]KAF3887739.1 hypothetical protein DA73_0400021250 [Tolypothrix bouteillei VB521301]